MNGQTWMEILMSESDQQSLIGCQLQTTEVGGVFTGAIRHIELSPDLDMVQVHCERCARIDPSTGQWVETGEHEKCFIALHEPISMDGPGRFSFPLGVAGHGLILQP